MATLAELVAQGILHKYDPELDDDDQELRRVHASDRFKTWVEKDLCKLASAFGIEQTPEEQVDAFMAVYASGLPLVFDRDFKAFQPRAATPLGDGVWYLKTQDTRIFGWFWKKDCFIAVAADTAERCKMHNLYQGYRGEVVPLS
jgi:hypothetical protein